MWENNLLITLIIVIAAIVGLIIICFSKSSIEISLRLSIFKHELEIDIKKRSS